MDVRGRPRLELVVELGDKAISSGVLSLRADRLSNLVLNKFISLV